MRPYPAARIGAAAARQASQVPTTLTSRQARRSATASWSKVPRAWIPALVTSTSIRPCPARTASVRAPTARSLVTSQARPCTAVPVRADSRAAASAQRPAERLASTTVVPAWARAAAMARPSPAEPPVTTATCPARDRPGAAGPAGWS
jgi:hypothetical protein